MTTATTDMGTATKATRADGADKTTGRSRRTLIESGQESNGHERYFLGRPENNSGTPAWDREVSSEGEALVESLRLGVTYYVLKEFRVVPDFSGRRPQLKKELVQAKL